MLNHDTVIYEGNVNGEQYTVTFGQAFGQSDEVAMRLAHGAILRAINSAATNAGDDDDAKAKARAARLQDIIEGRAWQTGGGASLSEAERGRRHILASYAVTHANLKRSEAEDKARKDYNGLLAMTAEAIIRKAEGKKPDKTRLAAGVEKFGAKIEEDVKRMLSDDTLAGI